MLAIIPARGGSKGIPDKNIKLLAGKPLIFHTIAAAKKSKRISRVIVSTDSQKIAKIALHAGAEVPFLRPKILAGDRSAAIDAYLYTCERLEKEERHKINSFAVLLPTTPLRTAKDIDECISLFERNKADSAVSVCENAHAIQYSMRLAGNGRLGYYFKVNAKKIPNRQDIEKTYLPNGAVYVFKHGFLKKREGYYSTKSYGYLMPPERSVDIDTRIDFALAELICKKKIRLS